MAIEDSAVLCEMLSDERSWADVIPAFAARREPRVRSIVDQSRRIGQIAQLENPALASLRNWIVWATPRRVAQAAALRAIDAEI